MKVALLLFGQPRNVNDMKVYNSHHRHIIGKYDTDVFCHMWYENGGKMVPSTWSNLNPYQFDETNVTTVINNYKPVEITIEQPKTFEFDQRHMMLFVKVPFSSELNRSNTLSQLYSIEKVASMVSDKEKYDFIIVCRYDIVIDEFPDLYTLDKNYFYMMDIHTRFPDLFYIFPPKYMKSQYTFSQINEICDRLINGKITRETGGQGIRATNGSFWGDLSSEFFKFNSFLLHYERSNIKMVRIREHRNT